MSNLTPDELARLRLKANHGMLTPEEQRAYNDYATEQLSAVPSPPSGAVPPKKGFKWESEKVAEWRLKARHDGLDENERLLYQDYQQTLALAGASVEAENKAYSPKVEKCIIFRGAVSLALMALIGLFSISGCKLSELALLVPYTSYQLGYALTGEMPNAAAPRRVLQAHRQGDVRELPRAGRHERRRHAQGGALPAQVLDREVALAGCRSCPERRARRVRFG